MDKELILMCDTPEIQDRWEPKEGDQILFQKEPELADMILDLFLHSMGHEETEDMRDDEKIEWAKEHVKFCYIYIPRIEDVLECIGDQFDEIGQGGLGWYAEVNCTPELNPVKSHISRATTPIKALLKAYMHLEHNKTWNGEAWA